MARSSDAGISLDEVTRQLRRGRRAARSPTLRQAARRGGAKRAALLGHRLDGQSLCLGAALEGRVAREAVEAWRASGASARLWAARRHALDRHGRGAAGSAGSTSPSDAARRTGRRFAAFAEMCVKRSGFTDALLLGMGGSSLGPGGAGRDLRPPRRASRSCCILDSTDPGAGPGASRQPSTSPARSSSSRASPARRSSRTSSSDYFFERVKRGGRRRRGRHALRRDHRSRARSWRRRAKADGFRARSSTACRASAAATRRSRTSAWCRRR